MKECSSDKIAASIRRFLIRLPSVGSVQDVGGLVLSVRDTRCWTRTKLSAMSQRCASPSELITSAVTMTSLAAAIVRSFVYVPLTSASPHAAEMPHGALLL